MKSWKPKTMLWDSHICLPLQVNGDVSALYDFKKEGFNFVSVNVGMDYTPADDVLNLINYFRSYIEEHSDQFILAQRADDISKAIKSGQLAIAFDLEGSNPLLSQVERVEMFYDLGVRQMLLAYNADNDISGGCQGSKGLTDLGKQVVREMQRVGMTLDLSHMSEIATLEAIEMSSKPVIFSHSNAKSLENHERNITDQQIKACAATGGVVGVNGVNLFLAPGAATVEKLVDHIDYISQLVGPQHVGLGLDFMADAEEVQEFLDTHPEIYPKDKYGDLSWLGPYDYKNIPPLLEQKGFSSGDIELVMGGNFYRVAVENWL